MDEVDQLIHTYRVRATSSVPSKLDVLMDIERMRDARIVPFLLHVLTDPLEDRDVRIHVLRRLRSGSFLAGERSSIAQGINQILLESMSQDLRVQAALALGEFTDIQGVMVTLGSVALAQDQALDLRYSAFTSLERAGPTSECVALLRQLTADDTLGRSARSVLTAWHLK